MHNSNFSASYRYINSSLGSKPHYVYLYKYQIQVLSFLGLLYWSPAGKDDILLVHHKTGSHQAHPSTVDQSQHVLPGEDKKGKGTVTITVQ